eukprot:GHVT01061205.1.p1 GENE.GHVT01061205.1~~GHVT01061205.1.p1  ORF type:complete len:581 (-),score=103.01 GHVT01061205.1:743-2485(-)
MLKLYGVRKGDTVSIYMPMVAELAYAMLAVCRLGAVHSVVFAGFSASSLRDRIVDAGSQVLVTADRGRRGGKIIPLKAVADDALADCPKVHTCIVFKRTGMLCSFQPGRDVWGDEVMPQMRPYCSLEPVDSEDYLFMLHTSGSTGKPKGVVHSSAGYLLYAMLSHRFIFDYHPGDVYTCVADVGWITGHSYIIYGPLANGGTTLLFEGVPTYPDLGRYWQIVQQHQVAQFYTAPTAIRALMRHGDSWPRQYDLSSLRVLGTVGEPINPEAWRWYHDVVGGGRCSIVDTYWQTETGGHILTPFPGATKTKPGAACRPFFGVDPVIVHPLTGAELRGHGVHGVLCIRKPWPGIMRTLYGAHERMMKTYMHAYPGLYFTGDGAVRDMDGYYWITGRVDDTLNVSGHRLDSAELEYALVQHSSVAEAAVVGIPHDLKGTGIFCYVVPSFHGNHSPMNTVTDCEPELKNELKQQVRASIGPIATPDTILICNALPKTRSGKIMRRLLRKIANLDLETLGDVSTLANPEVIGKLSEGVKLLHMKHTKKAEAAGESATHASPIVNPQMGAAATTATTKTSAAPPSTA